MRHVARKIVLGLALAGWSGLAVSAEPQEWECPLQSQEDMTLELKAQQRDTGFLVGALERADVNQDGVITRAEAASAPGVTSEFDSMDINRDESVTVQEVADWLRTRLLLQARVMMRMGDSDRDGVISRDEARRYPLLQQNFDQLSAGNETLAEKEIFMGLLSAARKADLSSATRMEQQEMN